MMTISVNIGARRPAYATAMGRVLLANLPPVDLDAYFEAHELVPVRPRTIVDVDALCAELHRVREVGYALVDQELEEGLVAIAVPVRDRNGRVRAAINLSTHIGRKSVKEMRSLVPAVRAAAADIEVGLRNLLAGRAEHARFQVGVPGTSGALGPQASGNRPERPRRHERFQEALWHVAGLDRLARGASAVPQ